MIHEKKACSYQWLGASLFSTKYDKIGDVIHGKRTTP